MVSRFSCILLAALIAAVAPAHAQLGGALGGVGPALSTPLGQLPGTDILRGSLGRAARSADGLAQNLGGTVDSVARDLVGRPLQSPLRVRDPLGAPIVKGEVLAISPSAESLAIARRLNFTLLRQDRLDGLGLNSAALQVPDGMDEAGALAAIRAADPDGIYDYAHIYNPTGGSLAADIPMDGTLSRAAAIRIGMIDGGIEKRHPALAAAAIVSQVFAGKDPAPASAHGTAIASLLVGKDGAFSGYLPGAKLYAADVFGGAPDGGSAAEIARALNWLAENHIAVTNISLAGPPNALLAAAVKAFVGKGFLLVAAVGNDGPAAAPNYPAAYDGVIGVTSVDGGGHLQIDANRNGARFAARGVDVRAASLPRGYASMTGTSYAAPAVAAQLALLTGSREAGELPGAVERLSHLATPLADGNVPYLAAPQPELAARR